MNFGDSLRVTNVDAREAAQPKPQPGPAPTDLEFRIAKVKLEPGDVLVLKVRQPISMTQAATLREMVIKQFPDHKALVLMDGIDLAVMTETDVAKLGASAS